MNAGGKPAQLNDGKPSTQLRIAEKKETTKVKLTAAQKLALGITQEGEEVEDSIVLVAVDSLSARATEGEAAISAARAECLRVATLAEGTAGADGAEAQLSPELAALINGASAAQLPGLTQMYAKKSESRFPLTCEHGHKASGRSSVESPETVTAAAPTVKRTSLL
jgi:hypothetical protein